MAPTNTKKATKLADPKATVIRISLTGLAKKPRVRKGAVLRGDGLEEGGVDALLVDAVKAKGGALHSALCRKLKWKKCSRRLARAAKIAGLELKATRIEGGDIRFQIARGKGERSVGPLPKDF